MKRLLLILSFVACYSVGKAQAPNWIWAESSNGSSFQYVNGLSIDTANNLFLSSRVAGNVTFGGVTANTGGSTNAMIGKFDTAGNAQWLTDSYNYNGFDYVWGFCRDNKDNTYEAAYYLEKLNSSGARQWGYALNGGGGIAGSGLVADNSGNIYLVSTINGASSIGSINIPYTGSGTDVVLAKLDSNGNCIWAVSAGGTGANSGSDVGRGIALDVSQGHVYITGGYTGTPTFGTITAPAYAGNGSQEDLFIAEYDTSGNALNVVAVPNGGYNTGDCCDLSHIRLDSCNNLYIVGYFTNSITFGNNILNTLGQQDIYVAKCNSNGVWQWANDIGSSGNSITPQSLTLDENQDIYIAGDYNNNFLTIGDSSLTGGNTFIAKFANSTGALLWAQNANTPQGGFGGITVDKQLYVYGGGNFNGGLGNATFGSHSISGSGANTNIFLAKLDTVPRRVISPIINSPYCPGSTDTLYYNLTGTFYSGNTFTAQLSDSTGSFANPQNIGDTTSTTSGSIIITIPNGIPSGSDYQIRVTSTNPPASSYASGCVGYYINNVYYPGDYVTIGGGGTITPIISPVDTNVCPGASVILTASGGTSYTWNNGDTGSVITVIPATDSLLIVTAKSGCGTGVISDSIKVSAAPPFTILPLDTAFCEGQSAILYADSGGSNFIWAPGNAIADSSKYITGDSILVSPTVTTTYTVTGINPGGCATSGTDMVTIIASPGTPTFTQDGDTLISSSVHDNQWYRNDTLLKNDTSQHLIINTPGEYYVVVTNEVNGCSTSSDSMQIKTGINQVSVIGSQLSIYPNPFNNDIVVKINSSAQDVKDWNLQITDELGRAVFSRLSLDYSNTIDLSNLPSGIYFITVINKTGRVVVPVVKQD